MELSEFLEKFLTEYEQRINEIEELYKDDKDFTLADANTVATAVAAEFFPEALENFADRLCEKQRTECMNTYVLNEDDINRFICIEIQNCKQPEIEEL